jgi:hypothetical protein
VIEVQKQIKAQFHVQMIVLKSLMFFIYEILLAKKQEQRQVQMLVIEIEIQISVLLLGIGRREL